MKRASPRSSRRAVLGLVLLAECTLADASFAFGGGAALGAQTVASSRAQPRDHSKATFPRLPLAFVANEGQWPESVRFAVQAQNLRARVEADAIGLDVIGDRGEGWERAYLRLVFVGASQEATLESGDDLAGQHHFFLGSEPSAWRTGVPSFGTVRWRGLQPGVDAEIGERDGALAYSLYLAPQADLGAVELSLEGSDSISHRSDGTLEAVTPIGRLTQSAPLAWYERPDGSREAVECRFALRGGSDFSFELAADREPLPLVIDPGLTWSSYLGGVGKDVPGGVVVDEQGAIVCAGYTWSFDFPSVPGPLPYVANADGFVSRIELSGAPMLDFTAFIGGHGYDEILDLAIGESGRLYVAGRTTSSDLPATVGAFDTTYADNNNYDAFVAQMRPDGTVLLYCTFVGGASDDELHGIAVDALGQATVVGRSGSGGYPTTSGAFQPTPSAISWDGVVTRLDASGSALLFSTYLASQFTNDDLWAVAVDGAGNTYVAGGWADPSDYPVTPGAYPPGTQGGLVSKLDPTGSTLLASTVIGGSGVSEFRDIVLGPQGRVYLTGTTQAPDYPVSAAAFDTVYQGWPDHDMVVTCLDSDLTTVLCSTFLGDVIWSSLETGYGIAVDASGVVTIGGATISPWFPTTPGAFKSSKTAVYNGIVARLSPTLDELLYSSYLAGSVQVEPAKNDLVTEVALLPNGSAVFAGNVMTADFPTTPDALQSTYGSGGSDGFVAVMDLLPTGASRFGSSTPSCLGPIWIGVTKMPAPGDSSFALTSSVSPPGTIGFLAVGTGAFPSGFPLLGIQAFLDPSMPYFLLGATSDSLGWCERTFSLPPGTQGLAAYFQFAWLNTASCGGLGTFSASNALALTVQ